MMREAMVGRCPNCNQDIPDDDANESEGVALCRGCESLLPIDSLAEPGDLPVPVGVLKDEPPPGCWMSDDGVEMRIGVVARSLSFGGFFVLFAAFWNTVTGVFVVQAIGGFHKALTHSGRGASLGPPIFLSLFLVPFVIVGGVTAVLALVGVFGNVEVTIRGAEGEVFTGVGTIGRRRRFDATRVTDVRIVDSGARNNERVVHAVCIEAERPLKLASMATASRRDWLAGALKTVLVPTASQPGATLPPEERS
jgi:hypothetical protein